MKHLFLIILSIALLFVSCGEGTKENKGWGEKKDTTGVSADEKDAGSIYEQLSCVSLSPASLHIKNSGRSGFSFKVPYNVEKVDSVSVNRNFYKYDHPNQVELVLYNCYDISEYGSDFCMEKKFVPDSIHSYLKIDGQKIYLDHAFEKVHQEDFLEFNTFEARNEIYQWKLNDNSYWLFYFPCYYFGNQSHYDHQPVAIEFRDKKFYHAYFLPAYSFSEDPAQFTDFENDGYPEWICLSDQAVIYTLKDKSIIKNVNHFAEIEEKEYGYCLKKGSHDWPCEIK